MVQVDLGGMILPAKPGAGPGVVVDGPAGGRGHDGPAAASSADRGFHDAVSALYEQLDREIAAKAPLCTNRGECCRFGAFGHRLYVTQVEWRYFRERQAARGFLPVIDDVCPYQVDGRCTAREHRPLGCRVYFCDANSREWQPDMYERYLAALKRVGDAHDIEYRYAEWLATLRAHESAANADRDAD